MLGIDLDLGRSQHLLLVSVFFHDFLVLLLFFAWGILDGDNGVVDIIAAGVIVVEKFMIYV